MVNEDRSSKKQEIVRGKGHILQGIPLLAKNILTGILVQENQILRAALPKQLQARVRKYFFFRTQTLGVPLLSLRSPSVLCQ